MATEAAEEWRLANIRDPSTPPASSFGNRSSQSWQPPPSGVLKCNIGVSWNETQSISVESMRSTHQWNIIFESHYTLAPRNRPATKIAESVVRDRRFSSYIARGGPSWLLANLNVEATLKVGDVLREPRVFTSEDVKGYAEVSHDWNPLHFDQESARKAGFENPLVHGVLVSSMFPHIISSHFPGAVYVSQTLHFRSPVYVGDDILGIVQATALRETKNKYIVKFSTKCIKKHSELLVLDGDATAILPNLEMLQPSHSE
ncbi:hypothetical protein F2Q69_00000951 [Brassica cretica]|uniref:MaoC-like domain-containing protein n=1 Tax=Brassica cretica TaxID=69181 RepID=A0A8S9PHH5_BRACR|nr:hypothetical protein F2Q69_00000951 [Brassica cretica]